MCTCFRRNRGHRALCLIALALAASAQGCIDPATGTLTSSASELTYCCEEGEQTPVYLGSVLVRMEWESPTRLDIEYITMRILSASPWLHLSTVTADTIPPAAVYEYEVRATECGERSGEFVVEVFTKFKEPVDAAFPWKRPDDTRSVAVRVNLTCPSAPPPPPAGGDLIVFSNRATLGEDKEIWVIDADGGNRLQLTDNEADDDDPAWSPDRMHIAFQSFRDSGVHADIFVMNADGTAPAKKTDFASMGASAIEPAWSPDGNQLAVSFSNGTFSDIWVVDLTTDPPMPRQLTFQPAAPPRNHDGSPAWSENGATIYFVRSVGASTGIYSVPAAGGAPSLELSPAGANDGISAIDAGPAGFVFDSYLSAETATSLARWDGGLGIPRVTSGGAPGSTDLWPSWSPSSEHVVFSRTAGEIGQRLYTVLVDSGSPHVAQEIPNQPQGPNTHPDWGLAPRP